MAGLDERLSCPRARSGTKYTHARAQCDDYPANRWNLLW